MKTNKFELMKVFDCYDMPKDIKSALYYCTEGTGNHCYVNWYVGFIEGESPKDYDSETIEKYRKVDKWLIENGAEDKEKVIVEHSW